MIEQLIKEVSGYRYYSTLDMTQSFHQNRLDKGSSHVTAVTVFGKKYAYNVLPISFIKALAMLQETVSQLIQESRLVLVISMIFLVYSSCTEEHRKSLLLLSRSFQKNYRLLSRVQV